MRRYGVVIKLLAAAAVATASAPAPELPLALGGQVARPYEGCEELLYERLEQRYESVPGGPFKVWRKGPPFPAPEAAEPEF